MSTLLIFSMHYVLCEFLYIDKIPVAFSNYFFLFFLGREDYFAEDTFYCQLAMLLICRFFKNTAEIEEQGNGTQVHSEKM